jgi:hypothetical protein
MCRAIGLSERRYYAARSRPPCARQLADPILKGDIARLFDANWRCYGGRRSWLALRRGGHRGGLLRRGRGHSQHGYPTLAQGLVR